MNQRTIVEAITEALTQSAECLSAHEIYEIIESNKFYTFNTKSPVGVVRQQVRRHCEGLSFPSAMPRKYFFQTASGKYGLIKKSNASATPVPVSKDKIPEEYIQQAHEKHISETKQELLDRLITLPPRFFEALVLDLLLKMGYGINGSIKHSLPGADGGIDGEIHLDRLGFDRIYVQVKRYALNRTVEASQIRDFIGAMKNGVKGAFITTSKFSKPAMNFADKEQQQKNLALIDGDKLAQLMIEHGLGIIETKQYSTYKLDPDYFYEL
ncbi:restriction endonuclease [Pseudomonas sp. AA27]|uniref:restriction endonuclease n=1 Tax=Pseudomonas sp. AA27 TaxID=2908652 RepID=UPI001F29DAE5|nr:restriction endonuclease [Pseudomonas sp. AA27]MCF1489966.1 restriction endonuclease [Pseudomonas sp. AA27]